MKKCRIIERTNVNGTKSYVIQQKHLLFRWIWVDAWVNSWDGPACIDYFDTLEEHREGSGKDADSKYKDVNFVSNIDLCLTGASLGDIDLKVDTISFITKDFFGNDRAPKETYAGAHDPGFLLKIRENVKVDIRVINTSTGIEVQLDKPSFIELYSVEGKLLEQKTASAIYRRNLGKGVYIIRINGNAAKFVR